MINKWESDAHAAENESGETRCKAAAEMTEEQPGLDPRNFLILDWVALITAGAVWWSLPTAAGIMLPQLALVFFIANLLATIPFALTVCILARQLVYARPLLGSDLMLVVSAGSFLADRFPNCDTVIARLHEVVFDEPIRNHFFEWRVGAAAGSLLLTAALLMLGFRVYRRPVVATLVVVACAGLCNWGAITVFRQEFNLPEISLVVPPSFPQLLYIFVRDLIRELPALGALIALAWLSFFSTAPRPDVSWIRYASRIFACLAIGVLAFFWGAEAWQMLARPVSLLAGGLTTVCCGIPFVWLCLRFVSSANQRWCTAALRANQSQ